MGCVGRTAAVPAHQQLVSSAETFPDQICNSANFRLKILQRFQHPD
jgi:hypothetical protein